MSEPRRMSPLGRSPAAASPAEFERVGMAVREHAFRAVFVLHGHTGSPRFTQGVAKVLGRPPPDAPNTFFESRFGPETAVIAWTGPAEWLVISEAEGTSGLGVELGRAIEESEGAVVDVSSGWTIFSVEGGQARNLIAAGCPIDTHPRAFGPGRCAQTLFAGTGVCLLQRAPAPPRFELLVRRSYAAWLWRWLEASADLLAVE